MSEDYKGRLVDDVLEQIIKIIPVDETKLIDNLNKFKSSLFNKSPEVKRGADCWVPFINLLNFHIPHIKDEWQIEIKNIINITY